MAYHTSTSTISSYMHKHTLTLVDFAGYRSGRVCDVCSKRANELVYQCKPCGFHVHPRCTLIPRKLNHALHPNHHLVLQPSTTKLCGSYCDSCTSWQYSCESCDFHIHPKCALRNSSYSNSDTKISPDATSTPQRVQAEVQRDYAGVTSASQDNQKRNQITCPTSLVVKRTPQVVQADRPRGYAGVTSSPQDNHKVNQITCHTSYPQRMQAEVPKGYACVTSSPQDNHKRNQITSHTSSTATLAPQRVQGEVPRGYAIVMSAPKDNPIVPEFTCPTNTTLSSYMHKHILTLMNYTGSRRTRACDVCSEKVNEHVYQCKPCGFDVHPLCTQFPKQLKHALHPNHQLVLQSSTTKPCEVCCGACTSWRYSCKSCDFHIHPKCVLQNSRHSNSNTNIGAKTAPLTPQPVQKEVPQAYSTSMTSAPQKNPMVGHQISYPASSVATLTPQQVQAAQAYSTSVTSAPQKNPMPGQKITCPASSAAPPTPQRVQAEVPRGYSMTSAPQDNFNYLAPNMQYEFTNYNVPHYYHSNFGSNPVQGSGGTVDNSSGFFGKNVQDVAAGVISNVISGAFNNISFS